MGPNDARVKQRGNIWRDLSWLQTEEYLQDI